MKKLLTVLLLMILSMGLCACSAVSGNLQKENEEPEMAEPEYYGTWRLVGLKDLTGEYDDILMEQVLEDMREKGADFIVHIADESFISYGEAKEALIFDFEKMIVTDESGQSSSFTYEDGQIAFDISDKYHCIFEKEE